MFRSTWNGQEPRIKDVTRVDGTSYKDWGRRVEQTWTQGG